MQGEQQDSAGARSPSGAAVLWRSAVRGAQLFAIAGLACGLIYAFGGLIVDLLSIGLNQGTALAFMAIAGMPLMFAVAGFGAGAVVGAARWAAASGA